MSTLSWVVGRGGLLGSCVERRISSGAWHPDQSFPWGNPEEFRRSVADAVRAFHARLVAGSWTTWAVYWCAGSGVIGTLKDRLLAETENFRFFLDRLGAALCDASGSLTGQVFLASSAGGVYGGSSESTSTEATPARAISDYGQTKLDQEEVLRDWVRGRPTVATLVGRLSNLYGPGQHLDKPQGLISHMSRCMIFGVPVRIYVSLDTTRDYLFAEDAAARITAGMTRLGREALSGNRHVTKIYSSGSETTVAGLIGIFRRIAKRQLRVISGLNPVRTQQPVRLHFRSTIWPDEPVRVRTELFDGVSRVHRHQLALFQAGRLPSPF